MYHYFTIFAISYFGEEPGKKLQIRIFRKYTFQRIDEKHSFRLKKPLNGTFEERYCWH